MLGGYKPMYLAFGKLWKTQNRRRGPDQSFRSCFDTQEAKTETPGTVRRYNQLQLLSVSTICSLEYRFVLAHDVSLCFACGVSTLLPGLLDHYILFLSTLFSPAPLPQSTVSYSPPFSSPTAARPTNKSVRADPLARVELAQRRSLKLKPRWQDSLSAETEHS